MPLADKTISSIARNHDLRQPNCPEKDKTLYQRTCSLDFFARASEAYDDNLHAVRKHIALTL
jgi:hypothetical protein